MIISVTERGQFKRCQKQWDYGARQRQAITPLMPPKALAFGSLVHKVHELWLVRPDEDPVDIVMEVATQTMATFIAAYKASVGVRPSDDEIDDAIGEHIMLAREMFKNYKEYWGASLPEGFTLVAPEQTILTPIPGTRRPCSAVEHSGVPALDEVRCSCKGTGFEEDYLEATLDVLLRDPAGQLWVGERKTYAQRPRLESLESNDQFLAYNWILTQLNMGPVGGILYDGMWKKTKEGRRGLSDLFIRYPLTRSPRELEQFERELKYEVEQMRFVQRTGFITSNWRWEGCWDCSFYRLHLAEYRGEDHEYVRQNEFTSRDNAVWLQEAEVE